MVDFAESAFRHGYDERDYYEVLAERPLKTRSRRGLKGVYEIYGQNLGGEYLHIVYRLIPEGRRVFHIRRMSERERRFYRSHR